MTFAQALARIEWLCTPGNSTHPELYLDDYNECRDLLIEHADSIVQLGKCAESILASVSIDQDSYGHYINDMDGPEFIKAIQALNSLMGEGK